MVDCIRLSMELIWVEIVSSIWPVNRVNVVSASSARPLISLEILMPIASRAPPTSWPRSRRSVRIFAPPSRSTDEIEAVRSSIASFSATARVSKASVMPFIRMSITEANSWVRSSKALDMEDVRSSRVRFNRPALSSRADIRSVVLLSTREINDSLFSPNARCSSELALFIEEVSSPPRSSMVPAMR